MRLVLDLDPSQIEFVEPLDAGPNPFLLSVGTLRQAARAGHLEGIGSSESPSVDITLDKAARKIIGRPLRARATIYDDDDELYFVGLISGGTYGAVINLTVEA